MPTKSIAEDIRQKLDQIWESSKSKQAEDPWIYTKALSTFFVDYVAFSEKMIRGLVGRIKQTEEALQAAGIVSAPPQSAAAQGAAAPAAPQRRPMAGPPGPGWVRLDANREPMSPEDQAAEEEADLQFNGVIDASAYVPITSPLARGAGAIPPQPAEQPAPQPARAPAPPAPQAQPQPQPQPPNGTTAQG